MTELDLIISIFSCLHRIQAIPFIDCNHYKKSDLFTTSFSKSDNSFSNSTISIFGNFALLLKSLQTEMTELYLIISIFSCLDRIHQIPFSNCNNYKKKLIWFVYNSLSTSANSFLCFTSGNCDAIWKIFWPWSDITE
jgi:hypothetical protein